MVSRGRADNAIAITGLGRQFLRTAGTPQALALEAAGQAIADAGFPGGQGLSGDRAGVIIGTTLARPGNKAPDHGSRAAAAGQRPGRPAGGPPAAVGQRPGRPAGVPAAGRAVPPVLTAETMQSAAGERGGTGTIAGQVCARFGLHGAGHTVDGSRFSSLLAVAAACSALAAGDLDFVLAGGVDTGPEPEPADTGGSGADGLDEVRARDARPTARLPAYGCGVVALMRASDAVAAGAPVYAEITGWGMCADAGTDGPLNGRGRTSPSLRRACQQARIDPGTERLVIDTGRTRAAGAIAGVLKAAEAVASGSELAEVSARGLGGGSVNLLLTAPARDAVSCATAPGSGAQGSGAPASGASTSGAPASGASTSGAPASGGLPPPTEAAVSADPAAGAEPGLELFAFSGDDPGALIAELNRIADIAPHVSGRERLNLVRQHGRKPPGGTIRAAFAVAPARDTDELAECARRAARLLTGLPAGVLRSSGGVYAGRGVRGRTVLLFPGGLEAAIAAPPTAGHPEPEAPAGDWRPGSMAGIYRASRDALRWLDRLGVAPAAAIGHGPGELTGLVWAGCVSEEDADRLITVRDGIIRGHRAEGTATLSVAADAVTSRKLCDGTDLVIAAYNGPRAHVLAGPAAQVRMAANRAAAEGVASEVIPATPAFHSRAMAACGAAFRDAVGEITFGPPLRRLISTISGRELDRRDNIPAMLADQFTAPARFLEAVRAVARETDLFCAAGPGQILAGLASECWPLPAVTVPGDVHPGAATAAAALFAAGAVTALDRLFEDPVRPVIFLRDQVFIPRQPTSLSDSGPAESGAPSANVPNVSDGDETSSEDTGRYNGNRGKHPGKAGTGGRTLDGQGAPATPEIAPVPRRSWTMTLQRPTGSERGVNASMPEAPGTAGPPEMAGPWGHCFTEVLRPLGQAGSSGSAAGASGGHPPGARGRWRIRVAGSEPPQIRITDAFRDDAHALSASAAASADGVADGGAADAATEGVLCYVPDPAGPGAADALLKVGKEAAGPGRLVIITHGPGLAGFCRSLRAAHPRLGITLIRAPASVAGVRAARQLAAAEHGTFRELVLAGDDPSLAAMVSIEPVVSTAPGRPAGPGTAGSGAAGPGRHAQQFRWRGATPAVPVSVGITAMGPADVVLVTVGAGRAAATGLACAEAVGRTGAAVALIGPDSPGGHLQAGLARLRGAGACAGYEAADLTDPAPTAEAIARLEERLGRVTAVVHASGIDAPAPSGGAAGEAGGIAPPVTDDGRAGPASGSDMDDVLRLVTGALRNVMAAVQHRRLRLMVTFGSVAGQYGLAGGERDALASGAMRNYAERLRERLAGCRAVHVDWPPSTALDAGRTLLRFLTTAGAPDTIIVHDPEAAAGTRTAPPGTVQLAPGAGSVSSALRGRFLESVQVHYPGSELVAEARLSPATDPYLSDYRTDGVTVLPAVMGLEAMAEAASALAGRCLSRAINIAMGAPVVVDQDRPAGIRISARNLGDAVETVLRSAETGYRTDHLRALFPLGAVTLQETGQPYPREALPPASPAASPGTAGRSGDGAEHLLDGMTGGIVDGTELYGPLRFPAGRFRRVAFLPALTSRNCRALLRGTDNKPWFGEGVAPLAEPPLMLGSPGVNDAAMHVLQACVPHRKLMPVGCESLTCSGAVVSGAVEVRATERSAGGGEYIWDVQAVDTDGRPVASWTGLRLRDAGPLRRDAPWSPMLLAVYLERGIAALGLDPELRITVRAGHPRQAAGIPVRSAGDAAPGSAANVSGEVPEGDGATGSHDGGRGEAVAGIYAIAGGPAASGSPGAGSGSAQLRLGSVLYPAAGSGGRARRSHLDGLTLTVDGAFPAACEWEAADGGRNADGGEEWAEDLGPGFAALRKELLERCDEPAALVDARLWTAAQCISKAGRRSGQQPIVIRTEGAPGPGDGRDGHWVLLRTGDAAIASTIVQVADVASPVALAIMARAADQAA